MPLLAYPAAGCGELNDELVARCGFDALSDGTQCRLERRRRQRIRAATTGRGWLMCRPRRQMLLSPRAPPLMARLPRWAEGCALKAQGAPGHVGREIIATSCHLIGPSCAPVQSSAERVALKGCAFGLPGRVHAGVCSALSLHIPSSTVQRPGSFPYRATLWCRTAALGSRWGCTPPPYLPAQWRLPPRTLARWRARPRANCPRSRHSQQQTCSMQHHLRCNCLQPLARIPGRRPCLPAQVLAGAVRARRGRRQQAAHTLAFATQLVTVLKAAVQQLKRRLAASWS